jgi:hypothetical protein
MRMDRIVKVREYQAMPWVMRYVMLEQDGVGSRLGEGPRFDSFLR